jgi:DNA-binding IclR family transcriptional regulator
MADERGAGRTVTSKVLAILAAFETGPSSRSLTEIAEAAAVPLPTAHRLVGELVHWGALDRDAGGRYHLGLRLWEVAQNAGRQLRETARPFLQDLFSLTQETAHLAVREGHEALYIDRVYSTRRVPRASRVGGRLPLHATAVGKVLLAYEEPWVRAAYLSRTLEAPTRRTHIDPVRLAAELVEIRESGFATTLEEVRAGSCSIAVPVRHRDHPAVAAVGLVMLSPQATQLARHLPALQGVARRIEAAVARYPLEYLTGMPGPGRSAAI